MKSFIANWFDGRSARSRRVSVESDGKMLKLTPQGEASSAPMEFPLSSCRILPPLGSGERHIRLPEGHGHLETLQNATVEELEKLIGSTTGLHLLHRMESRWKLALGALAVIVLLIALAYRYLIPVVADRAALLVPDSAAQTISEHALSQLDTHIFKPSRLDEWRRDRIQRLYRDFCVKAGLEEPTLRFRYWPGPPNAFALPYGTIVITDAMVDFVDDDAELLGVLAHETAHQKERHVLKQLFRQMGVFVLVSLAAGDASSIVSASATLPTMLIERGYGRDFENEADELGASYMVKAGLGVGPMVAFMQKIQDKYPDKGGSDLLSTHPSTIKRIVRLKELKEINGGR